jgi:putative peptidoglycan binding protein
MNATPQRIGDLPRCKWGAVFENEVLLRFCPLNGKWRKAFEFLLINHVAGESWLASLKAKRVQDGEYRQNYSVTVIHLMSASIESCKLRQADRHICGRAHSVVDLFVKIIGKFGLTVMASVALLQPAQGRSHGSTHSFSPAHPYSASPAHFSSRPRSFSGGNARYYRSSPRFSSQAAFRNRAYPAGGPQLAVNRTTALNPRVYSSSGPQLAAARRAALRSQGFDSQGRVLARSSLNWDRGRDHSWHGHRCHWRNNAWGIIDPWFLWGLYPWGYGYGYYPYGAYSYNDDGYYDDGYAPNEYSEYGSGYGDTSVSQVQAALARKGYYRGAIDGSFGPATRNALKKYQLNHGLEVTGRIDRSVIEALRLR